MLECLDDGPCWDFVLRDGPKVLFQIYLLFLCCYSKGGPDVLDRGVEDPFRRLEVFLNDEIG